MIKHTEQAIEHGLGNCTTGNWHSRHRLLAGSPTQIKSGLHPSEISAHGYCHVVPKQLQCPHTVTVYSARVIGKGYLLSKLNHLRSGWVWHQPCLIPNVIAKPQRNPFMMGAARRNLPEPPAREYIGRVFSQHREELEWLANFLTGDETIAAACLVDACALAESENLGFDEWLPKCACLATIRSAVQIQQRRIVQLSFAYTTTPLHSRRTYGFVLRLA